MIFVRKTGLFGSIYRVAVPRRQFAKSIQTSEIIVNDYLMFSGSKNSTLFVFLSGAYNNIIQSIKITNSKNGCLQCEMVLLKNFDFDIEPFTKITIVINSNYFFSGYLDYLEDKNITEKNDKIILKFKGLIEQLKRVRVEKTYPANTKIIDIIEDIVYNYVANETMIRYNANKIDKETNQTQTSAELETSKSDVYKLIESLARILNFDWGVDETGEFFCLPKKQDILKTFLDNRFNLSIKRDYKNVRNNVFIKRQAKIGTGETGWTIAFSGLNSTSVAKYGKKIYELQVPGWFDDNACAIIGNNILNEFAEPKESFTLKNINLKPITKFQIGRYKIIKNANYDFDLINNCDDINKIYFNTSDNTANQEINYIDFISGSGSLRIFNIQSNSQKIYEFLQNIEINGFIKKFLFFAKYKNINSANHNHFKIKILYGYNSYDYEIDLSIETNYFYLYKIELTNALRKINRFAIMLNDNKDNIELFIDKIYCYNYNYRHLINYLSKVEYILDAKNMVANLEFQYEPERFENFIQGLLSEIEMLKFVSEKR